ncbi:MAG: hypothetical protein LBK72_08775 [Bifidobacteriaceae bacterium]|jgi:hypothetical protein|nr:hypothetical protein [Bifidobacteriaceae bacterium]
MRRRHILLIALSTSVVLACWTMAALVLVPQVVDMLYVSALEAVLGETLGDAAPNHAAFPDAVRHAACRSGMGAG